MRACLPPSQGLLYTAANLDPGAAVFPNSTNLSTSMWYSQISVEDVEPTLCRVGNTKDYVEPTLCRVRNTKNYVDLTLCRVRNTKDYVEPTLCRVRNTKDYVEPTMCSVCNTKYYIVDKSQSGRAMENLMANRKILGSYDK